MTSNIRSSGPSGSAFQRGGPAETLVGIVLLVSFEVPHEASVIFRRPPLRRIELPIRATADVVGVSARTSSARLIWMKHNLISGKSV